jgi:hypothetical protein
MKTQRGVVEEPSKDGWRFSLSVEARFHRVVIGEKDRSADTTKRVIYSD